jgi:hypothetical protein
LLRRHPPYEHGVPGERRLTILMNRIIPALFSDWVRESGPEGQPDTSRLSSERPETRVTRIRTPDRDSGSVDLAQAIL